MNTNMQSRHPNHVTSTAHYRQHEQDPNRRCSPRRNVSTDIHLFTCTYCLMAGFRNLFNFKELASIILNTSKHDNSDLLIFLDEVNDILCSQCLFSWTRRHGQKSDVGINAARMEMRRNSVLRWDTPVRKSFLYFCKDLHGLKEMPSFQSGS